MTVSGIGRLTTKKITIITTRVQRMAAKCKVGTFYKRQYSFLSPINVESTRCTTHKGRLGQHKFVGSARVPQSRPRSVSVQQLNVESSGPKLEAATTYKERNFSTVFQVPSSTNVRYGSLLLVSMGTLGVSARALEQRPEQEMSI